MKDRLASGQAFLLLTGSESNGGFTVGLSEASPEILAQRGNEFIAHTFLAQQMAAEMCAEHYLEFRKDEDAVERLKESLSPKEGDSEDTADAIFLQSFDSKTIADKCLEFDFGMRIFASIEKLVDHMRETGNSPFTDPSIWQGPGCLDMEDVYVGLSKTVDFLTEQWPKSLVQFVSSRICDYESANMYLTPSFYLEGFRHGGNVEVGTNKTQSGTIGHHECQISAPLRLLASHRNGNFGPITSTILATMDMSFAYSSPSPPESSVREFQQLRSEMVRLLHKFESLITGMSL